MVAQMVKNLPAMQETWIWSLGQEDTLEKGMTTIPVFLSEKSHGQRAYSPWGHKELNMIEQLTLHYFLNMAVPLDFGGFCLFLIILFSLMFAFVSS